MTCPRCGKILSKHMVFDRKKSQIVYACSCGYSKAIDRSGLTYKDVLDRYQFPEVIRNART